MSAESEFLPQLVAAAKRVVEVFDGGGPMWGVVPSLDVAIMANEGDEEAQEILRTERSWQLTDDGLLPTSADINAA